MEPGIITDLATNWQPLISILILGLVQVVKQAFGEKLPARVIPLMNVVLGMGFMVAMVGFSIQSVVAGMMLGFGASGIWSTGKTVKNG